MDRSGWALVLAVLNLRVLLSESLLISGMDVRDIGCEFDRTGWALVLAVLNLCVLLPESFLISEMDVREIGSEFGRWIELAGLWYERC